MTGLEGGFQIEHYHSYTCGTVRAVLEIVQIESQLTGTYRFERHDNGEITWFSWPQHDGAIAGEALDHPRWRWRLSLAGTICFARPVEDGRIGIARHETAQFLDDHLERIQLAPGGEPYRDLLRSLRALSDLEGATDPRTNETRTLYVSYIAAALDRHATLRTTLPAAARLAGAEPVDLRALIDDAVREATREEHAYFDDLRQKRTLSASGV